MYYQNTKLASEKIMDNNEYEKLKLNQTENDAEYHELLYKYHADKLKEIDLLPISDRIKHNIDEFLTYCGISDVKLKLYTVQFVDGKVGLRWDLDDGYVSIFFEDGDKWNWEAKSSQLNCKIPTIEEHHLTGMLEKTQKYSGDCSWTYKNKEGIIDAYFTLPDEVVNLIILDDFIPKEFSERKIKKSDVHIFWVTNKYDGMLSGYGIYQNKPVYVDCEYETFFQRIRIFGVYKLSFLEKLFVLARKNKWDAIVSNKLFWNVYMKMFHFRNFLNRNKSVNELVKKSLKKKDDFRKSHRFLGYYEW